MNTDNESPGSPTDGPPGRTRPGRYPIDSDPIEDAEVNISASAWIGIVVAALVLIALVVAHLSGVIGPGTH